MLYTRVNGQYIFISDSLHGELIREVSAGRDSEWLMSSMIQGREADLERDQLVVRRIIDDCGGDMRLFHDRWVSFDFEGAEAVENVHDITIS